jgi:hypothetical protein
LIKRWISEGAINDGGARSPFGGLVRDSLLQPTPKA